MDYIELIEKVREELLQVVNQRCDDMIQMYQNGDPYNRSEIRRRECCLGRTSPSILKGKRPVSVTKEMMEIAASAAITLAVKAAAVAVTDKRARTAIASVVVAVFMPFILITFIILSALDGTSTHNFSAVDLVLPWRGAV